MLGATRADRYPCATCFGIRRGPVTEVDGPLGLSDSKRTMRVLSSSAVPFYKFVLPYLWFVCWGAPVFILDAVDPYRAEFLGVGIIGSCLLAWYASRLRKVILDGETLVISDYSRSPREVRVPLTSVSEVRASRLSKTKDVVLFFYDDFGFGDRVRFLPKSKFLWPWQEHPIAAELRQLSG